MPDSIIRILHTADWHIGARLFDQDRSEEHREFLNWLLCELKTRKINILLVSGDIFDSAVPKQESTGLYFQFLSDASRLEGLEIVITGGNHDSAMHLDGPRELLRRMNIHVFGCLPEQLSEAILDFPGVTVAAIPFLRERELRPYFAASAELKESNITPEVVIRNAITKVYQKVAELTADRAQPVIVLGHLTAAGASRCPESERDIHIGNLAPTGPEIFQPFAYTALGHLHSYQSVAENKNIRYSGSPLPLSFTEANSKKWVIQLDVSSEGSITQNRVDVPQARPLRSYEGSLAEITKILEELPANTAPMAPGLELRFTSGITQTERAQLVELSRDKAEIIKFTVPRSNTQSLVGNTTEHKALAEIPPEEVFQRLLSQNQSTFAPAEATPEAQSASEAKKARMVALFAELLASVNQAEETS